VGEGHEHRDAGELGEVELDMMRRSSADDKISTEAHESGVLLVVV